MAHTHCPGCNKLLRVPSPPARVRVRCPQCMQVFVTVPREEPHQPAPGRKKPIAVPAAPREAAPADSVSDAHATHRCAIGPMAQTQFGRTLDVEGVELPFAADLAGFLDRADYRHACCVIIDTGDFARFHSAVLEHMRQRFGPANDQALAVNYARLICFACGAEYSQATLQELRKGRTQDGDGAARADACSKCGKGESLYIYDNLAAGNVTSADIDALREYWRHRAKRWWAQQDRGHQPCFACDEAVLPGHGFRRDDRLYCPRCAAGEDDLAHLRSNPHYFGSGELTRARAFAARQAQDA